MKKIGKYIKNLFVSKNITAVDEQDISKMIHKESEKERYAKKLGVKYHEYEMPKAYIGTTSAFYMQDNMVYLYPPNDGAPTKPIYFYDDGRLIFRNENAFQEITNLDEILLEMIQIYNKALDEKVSINSYGFMLELQDKLTPFYNGRASLVMTDRAIPNENSKKSLKYYINSFLDRFIGWNFGVSVNRNNELKKELEKLNEKVINLGLREYKGIGFEVYGTETEVYNGLQHYYLPTETEKTFNKK